MMSKVEVEVAEDEAARADKIGSIRRDATSCLRKRMNGDGPLELRKMWCH